MDMADDKKRLIDVMDRELHQLKTICDRLSEKEASREDLPVDLIDKAIEQESVKRSISMIQSMEFSPHLLHNMED